MLKSSMTFLFIFFILNSTLGQTVSIELEKDNYKIDELITIIFHSDFRADSIHVSDFNDLKKAGKSSSNTSSTLANGKSKFTKRQKYYYKPTRTGKIKIKSSTFFLNGQEITCPTKIIQVKKSTMTNSEIEHIKSQQFIDLPKKKEGSYRYILNEKYGYIEIKGHSFWKFHRRLTKKEFKRIKKVR